MWWRSPHWFLFEQFLFLHHPYIPKHLYNVFHFTYTFFCLGTEVLRHSAHIGTDGRLVRRYVCRSTAHAQFYNPSECSGYMLVNGLSEIIISSTNLSRNLEEGDNTKTPECREQRFFYKSQVRVRPPEKVTRNEWSPTAKTTGQVRIRPWGKVMRNEWSVTAKTTGQERFILSDNAIRKINDLPRGLISRLACSLCWWQKASDQRQQRLQ